MAADALLRTAYLLATVSENKILLFILRTKVVFVCDAVSMNDYESSTFTVNQINKLYQASFANCLRQIKSRNEADRRKLSTDKLFNHYLSFPVFFFIAVP